MENHFPPNLPASPYEARRAGADAPLAQKSTPKDVFLQLFNILTFYLSVVGFITLYIQYVNASFPDQLNYYFSVIASKVRWSTSILLIALPFYLLSGWMLGRELKAHPQKIELKLRHWLIYFTLFIAAVTIIVDLVILVNNFLSGELSTQFFLKVLIVLITVGAAFWYYLWDLKRKNIAGQLPKILAWVLAAVVVLSVVLGFFIVGTPLEQRQRRFDDQRVQDLQMLQSQIVNYWTQKQALPAKLSDLNDSISGFMAPKDPASKADYGYNVKDKLSFELCAGFITQSENLNSLGPKVRPLNGYNPGDPYSQSWSHSAGNTCFSRTIDPELYKTKNRTDLKTPID